MRGMGTLDEFIAVARGATDSNELADAMRVAVAGGLADAVAARPEPWFFVMDEDLTVFATRALPGTGSAPHDHGLDAVTGCLSGREGSRIYDVHNGQLTETRIVELGSGEVHAVARESVHAVFNCWTEPNVVLHAYLGNFLNAPKRVWDPITGTASDLGLGEPLAARR